MGELLKANEVAAMLRVDPASVYGWAKAGILPSIRIGGSVRFHPDTVKAIIDRGRGEPAQPPIRGNHGRVIERTPEPEHAAGSRA